MNSSLGDMVVLLPIGYKQSKLNKADVFALLQGITGFMSGIKGKDPFAMIGAAMGVVGHFTTKCNTGTLKSNRNNIYKWMTFGKKYAALKDSSELNFAKMDVTTVPEIMKVL